MDGYKYVLTFTDYFTKFVEFFPLKSKEACGIACGITTFVCRWGAPKRLISDQGREFVAKVCFGVGYSLEQSDLTTCTWHSPHSQFVSLHVVFGINDEFVTL